MWSRALFLLPKLPLYSCWAVWYSCCIIYSYCLVFYSCCLVLYRVVLVLCRIVSCCTRVVLCWLVLLLVLSCVVSRCTRVMSCYLVLCRNSSCCYSCSFLDWIFINNFEQIASLKNRISLVESEKRLLKNDIAGIIKKRQKAGKYDQRNR